MRCRCNEKGITTLPEPTTPRPGFGGEEFISKQRVKEAIKKVGDGHYPTEDIWVPDLLRELGLGE